MYRWNAGATVVLAVFVLVQGASSRGLCMLSEAAGWGGSGEVWLSDGESSAQHPDEAGGREGCYSGG